MKTIRLITLLAIVLIATIANAQTEEIPDSIELKSKLKADFDELSKFLVRIWEIDLQIIGTAHSSEKKLRVMENGIEFRSDNENTFIGFLDMADYNIRTSQPKYNNDNIDILHCGDFDIIFSPQGKEKVRKLDIEKVNKLQEDVIINIDKYNKKRYKAIGLFEPTAARYRALNVKPLVSEEQRKYIVQANMFNQKKYYFKAIELYNKVIKIDPTTYPAAYTNLALLSAQINKFNAAIYYMKKYLMLEPEASDARSCQDKIYEWEAQLSN